MLRKIRIVVASIVLLAFVAMFLDYTGTLHAYFGWLAKLQFLPAVLAINVIVIVGLLALTAVFGRVYCSVICPLGILQDLIGRISKGWGMTWKKHRYRHTYSPAKSILRYVMLGVMVVAILFGINVIVGLLAPYSLFGKVMASVVAPVMKLISMGLEYIDERMGTYMVYPNDVVLSTGLLFSLPAFFLVVLFILVTKNGRTWCNTICPVGTLLGFVSKYSLFKIQIDTEKCKNCGLCEKRCKASCLSAKAHKIDYTRCVACFDCLDECKHDAISFTMRKKAETKRVDEDKRSFVATAAFALGATAVQAQQHKLVDGGMAAIIDKAPSPRKTAPVPAGAESIENMETHCTSCQLCVTACPNRVLQPSSDLTSFMQPRMTFEHGHCRVGCTRCSDVCPTGAIKKIKPEEKTAIAVGKAVWVKENCVVITKDDPCGNCSRHCPTGAIEMVFDKRVAKKVFPVINAEKCIGCGACENLCPSRPLSAIYVEGYENHHVR